MPISDQAGAWAEARARPQQDSRSHHHVVDRRMSDNYRYAPPLMLSYPNEADRAPSKALGISDPDDAIMIHGRHPKSPFRFQPGDWTDGCFALTKKTMKVV